MIDKGSVQQLASIDIKQHAAIQPSCLSDSTRALLSILNISYLLTHKTQKVTLTTSLADLKHNDIRGCVDKVRVVDGRRLDCIT